MARTTLMAQNGETKPGLGTIGCRMWDVMDREAHILRRTPSIADLKVLPDFADDLPVNVRSIYARWRRFNGISGRIGATRTLSIKPTPTPILPGTGRRGDIVGASNLASAASIIDGVNDVDILADVLIKRFGHVTIRQDYGWPSSTALNVLDCVLSLNRRYDSVVRPRVYDFSIRYPNVTDISHLSSAINQYSEFGKFLKEKLNYNDVRREHTLRGLVEYMIAVQKNYAGNTERERLEAWAQSVVPADYASVGVKGFGLAGFQYMRMLFGVQTTKPDVHIISFVSTALGKSVNAIKTVSLLERVATKVNLPLREVDGGIWQAGARR